MRLYCFTNGWLSSLQNGIQSLHSLAELMIKYPKSKDVKDWAKYHKTVIILNGGDSDKMYNILEMMKRNDNPFPWASFNEPSIENALTSIAILLPENLYADELVGSRWESEFLKLKNSCPLAK